MTEIANRHIQAQYLSDWSLVRLSDGRVGVFTKRNHQGRVTLPGQTGVDVSLEETLALVKYPAELAAEALDRHYAEPHEDTFASEHPLSRPNLDC